MREKKKDSHKANLLNSNLKRIFLTHAVPIHTNFFAESEAVFASQAHAAPGAHALPYAPFCNRN